MLVLDCSTGQLVIWSTLPQKVSDSDASESELNPLYSQDLNPRLETSTAITGAPTTDSFHCKTGALTTLPLLWLL